MAKGIWPALRAALVAGALIGSGAAAEAAGALVIGACGAWGGSWNYDSMSEARERALAECKGRNCKVVVELRGNCAAFAYDYSRDCGAWGWATRDTQREAERVALRECRDAGGRRCRIRAKFCDGD